MTGDESPTATAEADGAGDDPSSLRWRQRLAKFEEILDWTDVIGSVRFEQMTPLERQGLVHLFECCHELAWRCLRDYFRWQGTHDLHGPKDAIREAFSRGLIQDAEAWMDLNACQSMALKSYQGSIADTLCSRIQDQFLPLMLHLVHELKSRASAWTRRSERA